MTLTRVQDVESILHQLVLEMRPPPRNAATADLLSDQMVSRKYPAPKFHLPKHGMLSETAAGIVRHKLSTDGKPCLNLASFVFTEIDRDGLDLCVDNITKNLADNDEYPALIELHDRCVRILANLWHSSSGETPVGTATTGSSEAIMLAGMCLKRRWKRHQEKLNKPTDKPNIIMGANAQVALEKFANYFEVECRLLDVHAKDHFGFNVEDLKARADENTIGVFVILGSTYTGHYQDVQAVSNALDELKKERGLDIPIHIDGASGAFVAPFCTPHLNWDFGLERVVSINTSGHKFGLSPVGCGWVVWRDEKYLPEELQFRLSYLGGEETTYTLNFSRPSHPIVHQYYNMLRLGHAGYALAHNQSLLNARMLSRYLELSGNFQVYSDIHRPLGTYYDDVKDKAPANTPLDKSPDFYNPGLPVVAFGFSDKFRKEHPALPQEAVPFLLRQRGYIIPNYRLPPGEDNVEVLRVVVNAKFTADFMEELVESLDKMVQRMVSMDLDGIDSKLMMQAIKTFVNPDLQVVEHQDKWQGTGQIIC